MNEYKGAGITIFKGGRWQKHLVKINGELKDLVLSFRKRPILPMAYIIIFLKLYRMISDMNLLEAPTRENVRSENSKILLDIRDEFIVRLKMHYTYKIIFQAVSNYIIAKLDHDRAYESFANWWLKQMIARGYGLSRTRVRSALFNDNPIKEEANVGH